MGSNTHSFELERDPLTGLMGRQQFLQELVRLGDQDLRDGVFGRFTLVYFNLLNFKLYNLTFGSRAGDECLQQISAILEEVYEGGLVARFSDDHFAVLTDRTDLIDSIEDIYHRVGDFNQHINAGIRYIDESTATSGDESLVCDQARLACDSIKKEGSKFYAVYSEELRSQLERNTYIVENLDQAISKGYIQVYFQPVVRALTGKLCSVEALTRWVDPTLGFMAPAIFIPVLEEAHLLHKLDTYVMQEVGRILRAGIDIGAPITPVSFNLSRTDFILSEPFAELEKIVQKYNLQRDLLCVEITESVLMSNPALVAGEIHKFREAGYEVWMDDFGSEYSSLNTLKEFEFDEIKIDMLFLRNLDDRGRQIIRAIVDMAKKLHVHTLAEGAETEEQVQFLQEIGCEKIQGYYYGRPQPIPEMAKHMLERGIASETRTEARMFDKAGEVNLISDTPIAIFESDGETLQMLNCNPAYHEVLAGIEGRSKPELNAMIDKPNFALFRKFQDFTRRVTESDREETLYYIDNGQKLRLKAQKVAGAGERSLLRASLENLTFESSQPETLDQDKMIRNLMTLYTSIYEVCPQEDTLTLLDSAVEPERIGKKYTGIENRFQQICRTRIYEEDRERLETFLAEVCSLEYLQTRKESSRCIWVRVRQLDGNYVWKEVTALFLKGASYSTLFCIKDSAAENVDDLQATIRMVSETKYEGTMDLTQLATTREGAVLKNLLQNTVGMYFWKDTDGRFQGASEALLSYFGMEDVSELVGRTGRELGLQVDHDQYLQDDQKILRKGESVRNVHASCIAKGQLRNIILSKFPVYAGGHIIGILGFFHDEKLMEKIGRDVQLSDMLDPVTGLQNMYGLAAVGKRFYEEYQATGRTFEAVLLNIPECVALFERYGAENAKGMIRELADLIKQIVGPNALLARTETAEFLAIHQTDDGSWAEQTIETAVQRIQALREINGFPCTMFVHAVHHSCRDEKSFDRLVFRMVGDLIEQENAHEIKLQDISVPFDLQKFDEMDESVYISDINTYELFYINRTGLRDRHLPVDYNYHGKKCYEVIMGLDSPCPDCSNILLRQDRFHVEEYHNPATGKDYIYRETLVPWKNHRVRFTTSTCLTDLRDETRKKEELIYHEMEANDAIGVALQEEDPEEGIRKLLERVGEIMSADRSFIYEKQGEKVTNTYLWKADEGMNPREKLIPPPDDVRGILRETFEYAPEFKLEEIDNIKVDSPELYAYLKANRIRSMSVIPIWTAGTISGYVGILNPTREALRSTSLLLTTLARFISIMLRNRDAMRKLDAMSRRDSLTGVMNRRAYHELQSTRTLEQPSAIIFADVNGLKQANDTLGHEAGDTLIRNTAHAMSSVVSTESVYRMGGDEFLIILEDVSRELVEAAMEQLRTNFAVDGLSVAMGLVYTEGGGAAIDPLVQEADARMYENKQKMHAQMKLQ